jgi:hypothetical protein
MKPLDVPGEIGRTPIGNPTDDAPSFPIVLVRGRVPNVGVVQPGLLVTEVGAVENCWEKSESIETLEDCSYGVRESESDTHDIDPLLLGLKLEEAEADRTLVRDGVEEIRWRPKSRRLRPFPFGEASLSLFGEFAAKLTAATCSGAASTMASIDAGAKSMIWEI